jgi:4-amino-4-deoxy-L-arabinose transferase-like glycosyltransferase
MILGAIAGHLFTSRAAVAVALGYVTLPMVAVGSLLISTDTIMFPFLAASLFFYQKLIKNPRPAFAVLCGLCLGAAFMGKYAAFYYLLCAGLAAPLIRPRPGHALLIVMAFLVAISPNLIWNITNGFTTAQHTLDNADWVRDPGARAGLNWDHLAEFFFAQFAVFGPVLMSALLWLALRWRKRPKPERVLLVFSLPIIAIVCVQATLSEAYANWAAAAYLAGSVLVLAKLPRPWLIASFCVNGFISLLFPLATTAPEFLQRDGQPLLNRYIGRAEMSQTILARAQAEGLSTIVADNRDILADLFYAGRDAPVQVFAIPPSGRPPHHYAQRFPYLGGATEVLLVLRDTTPVLCPGARLIETISPETGAYRRHPMVLYRAPGACLGAR